MAIRQTINQQRKLVVALAVLAIVGGLIIIFRGQNPAIRPVTKAFYTDDDGDTTFADDINQIPPFDHNGKPAVLARMYKTKNGKSFIAWLERYTDQGHQTAEKLAAARKEGNPNIVELAGALAFEIEIKKPHDPNWVRRDSPAGADIVNNLNPPDNSEIVGTFDP